VLDQLYAVIDSQKEEQVNALAYQLRPVAAHAFYQRLHRLLAQLFGDLPAAAAEQAGGIGRVWVGVINC